MSTKLSGEIVNFLTNCVMPAPKRSVPAPKPVPAPRNVPNVQGTYSKTYQIFRAPKSSQLPENITREFLNEYNFKYSNIDLDESFEHRIIVKQDAENLHFGVIYNDEIKHFIRPVAGLQPFIITGGGKDKWVLNSCDYDDNGKHELEVIMDDDNNVIRLEGYYTESGYNIGFVQAPTVGTVTYTKITPEIELHPNKVSIESELYDIEEIYFDQCSIESVETDWDGLNANGEFECSMDRNNYIIEPIPLKYYGSLVPFAELPWTPTHAVACYGKVMDITSNWEMGTLTSIKSFRTVDGDTTCISKCQYRLKDRGDWIHVNDKSTPDLSTKNTSDGGYSVPGWCRGFNTTKNYHPGQTAVHSLGENTIKIYNSTLKRSNRSASRQLILGGGSDSSTSISTSSTSTSNTNITNTMNNTTNNTDNSINIQSNVNTNTAIDSSMMTSNVNPTDNSSIMNINSSSPYTYTLDEAAEIQAMIDEKAMIDEAAVSAAINNTEINNTANNGKLRAESSGRVVLTISINNNNNYDPFSNGTSNSTSINTDSSVNNSQTNVNNSTTNYTDSSVNNSQTNVNTNTAIDSSMETNIARPTDNSSIMNINSSPYTYTLDEAAEFQAMIDAEFQAMIDNEYNNNNMN